MNINLENLESFSLHLSGVKTFPAVLNKRSTAADDDGTDRTLTVLKYFNELQSTGMFYTVLKYKYKYLLDVNKST